MSLALQTIAPVVGCGRPTGEGASRLSPVAFTLPMPPSTNALFKNLAGKGRVKTRTYGDWQMMARVAIKRQKVPALSGRILVAIGLELSNDAADVDNRIKAVLDILGAKHGVGVIEDDKFVVALLVTRLPAANGLAHVQLFPIRPMTAAFHPAPNGACGSWIIQAPNEEEEDHGDFAQ